MYKRQGIAGESGSGKTQTFFSLTGILSDNGTAKGIAEFDNVDLLKLNEKQLSKIRGKKIGFIFGSEASGLSNNEISYANYTLQIPTNPEFKSLSSKFSIIDIISLYFFSIQESMISFTLLLAPSSEKP